jgi:hypothetical protein
MKPAFRCNLDVAVALVCYLDLYTARPTPPLFLPAKSREISFPALIFQVSQNIMAPVTLKTIDGE